MLAARRQSPKPERPLPREALRRLDGGGGGAPDHVYDRARAAAENIPGDAPLALERRPDRGVGADAGVRRGRERRRRRGVGRVLARPPRPQPSARPRAAWRWNRDNRTTFPVVAGVASHHQPEDARAPPGRGPRGRRLEGRRKAANAASLSPPALGQQPAALLWGGEQLRGRPCGAGVGWRPFSLALWQPPLLLPHRGVGAASRAALRGRKAFGRSVPSASAKQTRREARAALLSAPRGDREIGTPLSIKLGRTRPGEATPPPPNEKFARQIEKKTGLKSMSLERAGSRKRLPRQPDAGQLTL